MVNPPAPFDVTHLRRCANHQGAPRSASCLGQRTKGKGAPLASEGGQLFEPRSKGALPQKAVGQHGAPDELSNSSFTNCGRSARAGASVRAKKVAACCCTKRYSAASLGVTLVVDTGANGRRPGLSTNGLHARPARV